MTRMVTVNTAPNNPQIALFILWRQTPSSGVFGDGENPEWNFFRLALFILWQTLSSRGGEGGGRGGGGDLFSMLNIRMSRGR